MDDTFGAVLVGTFLALMFVASCSFRGVHADFTSRLYGLSLGQTYDYLRVHSGDNYWIKCYVSTARNATGHPGLKHIIGRTCHVGVTLILCKNNYLMNQLSLLDSAHSAVGMVFW